MSMNDEFEFQEAMGEVRVRRMPSGGISAVLAVLLPGYWAMLMRGGWRRARSGLWQPRLRIGRFSCRAFCFMR